MAEGAVEQIGAGAVGETAEGNQAVKIPFRIVEITRDRRTKAQLEGARYIAQERDDQALERYYNERVRLNVQRRLNCRVEEILQMSADGSQPECAGPIYEVQARRDINAGVLS
jgi:hypothetical protein